MSEWIPVTDRLPPDDLLVWIVEQGRPCLARRNRAGWIALDGVMVFPTHWRFLDLPAPPSEAA